MKEHRTTKPLLRTAKWSIRTIMLAYQLFFAEVYPREEVTSGARIIRFSFTF